MPMPDFVGWNQEQQASQQRAVDIGNNLTNMQMRMQQMQRQQQEQQEMEQLKPILAQAGGDPRKAIQALLATGNPRAMEIAAKLHSLVPQVKEEMVVAPGSTVLDRDRKPIYTAPNTAADERVRTQVEIARQRAEDQSLGRQERLTAQRELIQLTASLRQPPPPQPLQAYIDPVTGKPKLGTRAEAHGNAPAVKETADRVIPASISKAYTENSTALRKIDSALAEVEKYPAAFGLQNIRGDAISQRVDPKGVTARAIISDIGSLKIHDRSGAAVTAAETPRLLPFIPSVNDKAETIKKKLALFRKEYDAIQNDIGSIYSADQGYRALPSAQTRSTDKPYQKVPQQNNTNKVVNFSDLK